MTDQRNSELRPAKRTVWISARAADLNLCGLVKHSDVERQDEDTPTCDGELVRDIGVPAFHLLNEPCDEDFRTTLFCRVCGDPVCDELAGLHELDLILAVAHTIGRP